MHHIHAGTTMNRVQRHDTILVCSPLSKGIGCDGSRRTHVSSVGNVPPMSKCGMFTAIKGDTTYRKGSLCPIHFAQAWAIA